MSINLLLLLDLVILI